MKTAHNSDIIHRDLKPANIKVKHTQWVGNTQNGGIVTNFGASNFGAVTMAADPRIIQLALKLSF